MTNVLLEEDIAALGPKQARMVLLNQGFDSIADRCFTVDHQQGGRIAARALLDHGHRQIAIVEGPASLPDNVVRVRAFVEELEAAGIDTAKLWRVERDFSPAGGWSAAKELMESRTPCTALFCANDEMAVGALSYFQEAGVHVPNELSVIGYDDTPSAEFSAPRLSTVHMPWREMTQNGVSDLLNRCYDLGRPVTRDYPVTMTLRASLAKAGAERG
jgi:LacI family transcriptional regulator